MKTIICALCLLIALVAHAELSDEVTLVVKPSFATHADHLTYLVLGSGESAIELYWSSVSPSKTSSMYPLTLNTTDIYSFVVERTKHEVAHYPAKEKLLSNAANRAVCYTYDVIRVAQSGRVLFDRSICEVHHTLMKREQLPISYGLPARRFLEPTSNEFSSLFPHHQEFVLGGCVVGKDKTALTFVCQKCRDARKAWDETHPSGK